MMDHWGMDIKKIGIDSWRSGNDPRRGKGMMDHWGMNIISILPTGEGLFNNPSPVGRMVG